MQAQTPKLDSHLLFCRFVVPIFVFEGEIIIICYPPETVETNKIPSIIHRKLVIMLPCTTIAMFKAEITICDRMETLEDCYKIKSNLKSTHHKTGVQISI